MQEVSGNEGDEDNEDAEEEYFSLSDGENEAVVSLTIHLHVS